MWGLIILLVVIVEACVLGVLAEERAWTLRQEILAAILAGILTGLVVVVLT